jgi:hypothetical protein
MKDEALRLADDLEIDYSGDVVAHEAAAELRRLHAENQRCRNVCDATSEGWRADADESEALRERLSALLTSTAIALRGPAPELVSWSWHDLPERAAALVAQRDALLEALKDMLNAENTYPYGGMSESEIAAIGKARAAIKAVEEEK